MTNDQATAIIHAALAYQAAYDAKQVNTTEIALVALRKTVRDAREPTNNETMNP